MVTMNNTTNEDFVSSHNYVTGILSVFSVAGMIINPVTILVILSSKKLRRPTNYGIVSFLLGAVIQSSIVSPTYAIKKRNPNILFEIRWLCDLYRMPYFFSGHITRLSLMIVSFDRVIAIKYPYRYLQISTKRIMFAVIIFAWLSTLIIDLIPFIPFERPATPNGCTYVPERQWGVSVIFLFNILPFILVTINYFLLWAVAAKMTLKDQQQNASIRSNDAENQNRDKEIKRSWKGRLSFGTVRRLRFAIEMKATKTSLLLVAVYVICWGPLGIFYAIDNFCSNCMSDTLDVDKTRASLIVKIVSLSSSSLLPLVYCWRNKDYQQELFRLCSRKKKSNGTFIQMRQRTLRL